MTSNNIITERASANPTNVDLQPIIEHGESPTAVILAVTIFTTFLLSSLIKLIDDK